MQYTLNRFVFHTKQIGRTCPPYLYCTLVLFSREIQIRQRAEKEVTRRAEDKEIKAYFKQRTAEVNLSAWQRPRQILSLTLRVEAPPVTTEPSFAMPSTSRLVPLILININHPPF